MIRFVWPVLLILAGVLLAPRLMEVNGYVLIVTDDNVLRFNFISLALFLLLAAITLVLLRGLFRLGKKLSNGLKGGLFDRATKRSEKAFTQGLIALDAADYDAAEKQLAKLDSDRFSGVDLLGAAQAAASLGNADKAKALWQKATEFKATALPAHMHLIEHHLGQDQARLALGHIEALDDKLKQHPKIVALWAHALGKEGQWQQLDKALKGWKKKLSQEDYQYWQSQAAEGIYAELASKEGAHPLQQYWQSLPRGTRKDPAQQAAYIRQLIDQGMHKDAEDTLLTYQKKAPSDVLLPLFRDLHLPNPAASIKALESWLKKDENNAEMLSILAQLAFNAGDFSLAEKALGKALTLKPNSRDIQLMAELKEQQAKPEEALALYKESLGNRSLSPMS